MTNLVKVLSNEWERNFWLKYFTNYIFKIKFMKIQNVPTDMGIVNELLSADTMRRERRNITVQKMENNHRNVNEQI